MPSCAVPRRDNREDRGGVGAVPAYATALEQVLGTAGLEEFESACETALPACNALARQLYDNQKIAAERTRWQRDHNELTESNDGIVHGQNDCEER